MRKALSLTLALATLTITATAFAQDHSARCPNSGSQADQDHTYCFEGEAVPGSLVGATGQGISAIRRLHGPSLIRMRAHFVPEMLKTVENL